MKYITSVHAYDCLDSVVYACQVREYEDYEHGDSHTVLDVRGSFPGRGLNDPKVWLLDLVYELTKSL